MKARTQPKLTIGRLAGEAGVGVETIRFYERKGLLKQPVRGGGFRQYQPGDLSRILFIQRAQTLGFTLREVGELLGLGASSKPSCGAVKKRADQKLLEISEKIKDLRRMQRSLREISHCCARGVLRPGDCSIAKCFDGQCNM